ncbi:thymidylate kinase [Longilinea arvoryzae]|uniref:Thymidylate kinase n=1 Tax=Longilinea arvoryzae TaxID=360412 RepID=A0A0S7B734_9CHLR|nr:dTMP kinase [Longilinea arvoryzae]GAP13087.1 thymidylate kinase [Longilinea arvoryzae]
MFITLEGPEGSGKTSQLPDLAAFLREDGWNVLTTREPGGTDIGDQVRQVLMRIDNTAMDPRAETLLFLAARAQLVAQIIRPALAEDRVVISDRYGDSTIAYQGYGHKNDLNTIRQMLAFATGGLIPDLTILMDVDPAIGLRRKKSEGEWNRMDAYELEFHRRVRAGYLELAREDPKRWVVLDASQSREMVQSALRQVVLARLTPPSVAHNA